MGNSLFDRFTQGLGQMVIGGVENIDNYVFKPLALAVTNFIAPKAPTPVAAVLASHGVSTVQQFVAQNYDGIPYVWGGESKKGVDCSGLVIRAFKDLVHVDLPHDSKEQAGFISSHFHLPLVRGGNIPARDIKPQDIPPYAVISIKRPGTGHVLMVMVDDHNQVVEYDSHGDRKNTASNPGKGVKEGSLQTLLARLHKEGNTPVDIVDTRPLFDTGRFNISRQMLTGGWQVTLEEKSKALNQTIKDAGLGKKAIDVNITTTLGSNELINHSVLAYKAGKPVINIAAGMTEDWTKYSVITRLAEFEHADIRQAMLNAGNADPEFKTFLQKKEMEKYGYGLHAFDEQAAADAHDLAAKLGSPVGFANGASEPAPASKTGGRMTDKSGLFPARIQQLPDDKSVTPQPQPPVQLGPPVGAGAR